jgi:beta-xylosidase
VHEANAIAHLWNAADDFSVTTGVSSGTERHADGAASWDTRAKRSSSVTLTMLGRQQGHMTRSWWSYGAQEVRQQHQQLAGRPLTVNTSTAQAFDRDLTCSVGKEAAWHVPCYEVGIAGQ